MHRSQRTIHLLLGLIALFLGILALQPILRFTSSAQAQAASALGPASNTTSSASSPLGGRVATKAEIISRINYRDTVLGVQAMDQQGVFLVWTKNMVEVYRVDSLPKP